jgi:hypothetical protein
MRTWVLALLFLAAMGLAGSGRAQAQEVPPVPHGPTGDPRTGPRLEYTRGPAECLSEVDFRREVTIAGDNDGVDRFDEQGAETVSVSFVRLPDGRYRGELRHTDAGGKTSEPKARTHANCEILGRWVAADAYYYLPKEDELPELPAPEPAPSPPPPPPRSAALPPARPAEPAPQRRPMVQRPRPFLCRILSDETCMDLTLSLMAMGILSVGYPSDVGGGFGLGAEVRGQWFSLGFQVRGLPPVSVRATVPIEPTLPSRETVFDISTWTVQLVPCVRYKFLMGCAVAEVGGFVTQWGPEPGSALRLAFGPRAGVDFALDDRVSLFGFGEALFPAGQSGVRFFGPALDEPEAGPRNVQWTEPIVGGFIGAGVSVHFK